MTRRDFEALAAALRRSDPHRSGAFVGEVPDVLFGAETEWQLAVEAIAAACYSANPRFDEERFLRATGYYTYRLTDATYAAYAATERDEEDLER